MGSHDRRHLSRIELGTLAASALAIAFGVAYAGPSPHMFGFFGLAQDQTVRVSIVNIDNPEIRSESFKFPSDSCAVQYKFFAGDGSVVVQSEFQKVLPGTSLSFDYKFSDLKIGDVISAPKATNFGAPRAQLRVATYLGDASDFSNKALGCPSDYKYYKLSVEVFDTASGKTSFIVPTDSLLPAVQ